MIEKILEQGDVIFFKEEIPKTANKMELKLDTVEYGEHTGHAHRITSGKYEYFETPEKTRHLRVVETICLKHEEHNPIEISPGDYSIGRVREKGMFDDMVAPVVD